MQTPRQITLIQATAVIISTIIGVGVLTLPKLAAKAAHSGAPLATIIALTLASLGLFVVTKLGSRFPRQSIVQYSERIISRWLAVLVNIAMISFFIFLTALTAREFGGVVIATVLMDTPLEVTVLVMLLLAAFSARHDIRTFAYIHLFYTPIILAPVLLIIIFSLKNANPLYLLPVYGYEREQMLPNIWTIAALFQGAFVYTMIIPYMKKPNKAWRSALWGMMIAGGLYVLIVTAAVSVFGPKETAVLLWPTLELAKATALPANVLERLDAAFIAVWVTAVFTTLLSSYYMAIHSLSEVLRFRDHRMLSFFVLPIIFVLAMIMQNIIKLYELIEIVGRIGLCLTIGYPICLLIVAAIRNIRGEADDTNQPRKTGT